VTRPPCGPKQLRVQQGFRQRPAVMPRNGPLAALRARVKPDAPPLLCPRRLAGDEHRRSKGANVSARSSTAAKALLRPSTAAPLQRGQSLGAGAPVPRSPGAAPSQAMDLSLDVSGLKIGQVRVDDGTPRGRRSLPTTVHHAFRPSHDSLLDEVHIVTQGKRHEAAGIAGQHPTRRVGCAASTATCSSASAEPCQTTSISKRPATGSTSEFLGHPAGHALQGVQRRAPGFTRSTTPCPT